MLLSFVVATIFLLLIRLCVCTFFSFCFFFIAFVCCPSKDVVVLITIVCCFVSSYLQRLNWWLRHHTPFHKPTTSLILTYNKTKPWLLVMKTISKTNKWLAVCVCVCGGRRCESNQHMRIYSNKFFLILRI